MTISPTGYVKPQPVHHAVRREVAMSMRWENAVKPDGKVQESLWTLAFAQSASKVTDIIF